MGRPGHLQLNTQRPVPVQRFPRRNAVDLFSNRLLRRNNWFYAGVGGFLQKLRTKYRPSDKSWGRFRAVFKEYRPDKHLAAWGLGMAKHTVFPVFGPARNAKCCRSLDPRVRLSFVFDKTNLTVDAAVVPALTQAGRVYTNTSATYYAKAFRWTELESINFYGNWDSKPPQNFSGSDYGITSEAWDGPSVIDESASTFDC